MQSSLEMIWALKAHRHAETYFKVSPPEDTTKKREIKESLSWINVIKDCKFVAQERYENILTCKTFLAIGGVLISILCFYFFSGKLISAVDSSRLRLTK